MNPTNSFTNRHQPIKEQTRPNTFESSSSSRNLKKQPCLMFTELTWGLRWNFFGGGGQHQRFPWTSTMLLRGSETARLPATLVGRNVASMGSVARRECYCTMELRGGALHLVERRDSGAHRRLTSVRRRVGIRDATGGRRSRRWGSLPAKFLARSNTMWRKALSFVDQHHCHCRGSSE